MRGYFGMRVIFGIRRQKCQGRHDVVSKWCQREVGGGACSGAVTSQNSKSALLHKNLVSRKPLHLNIFDRQTAKKNTFKILENLQKFFAESDSFK